MLVHQAQRGGMPRAAAPVHERLGLYRDMRNTIDARRHAHSDKREEASYGYHPRRGRRNDRGEDRSLSPNLPRP